MPEKEIRKILSAHPEILYGFTDISYCSYAGEYASALIIAVPYGEQLSPEVYTEERFEQGIQSARGLLETVVARIEEHLRKMKQSSGPFSPSKPPRPAPGSAGSAKMT